MKTPLRFALVMVGMLPLAGCGSDDSPGPNKGSEATGGAGGAQNEDEIDLRCSLSLCPNDAVAYNKEECDHYVSLPCFEEWKVEMNCRRENEMCNEQGQAIHDTIRACVEESPYPACINSL